MHRDLLAMQTNEEDRAHRVMKIELHFVSYSWHLKRHINKLLATRLPSVQNVDDTLK